MSDGVKNQGPLTGVRVIDLTINVLGPVATQLLGDMGAEVIKVETPAGDPMRLIGPSKTGMLGPFFQTANRNKKSVILDLKRPEPSAALKRLVETADVFVHNMRTAAAGRLGIDYYSLKAINPKLVYASATGYRKGGSKDGRPAYDDVIQGESGHGRTDRADQWRGAVRADADLRQISAATHWPRLSAWRCFVGSAPARARKCTYRCWRPCCRSI